VGALSDEVGGASPVTAGAQAVRSAVVGGDGAAEVAAMVRSANVEESSS